MLQLGTPYPIGKDEYYLEARNIMVDYRGEVVIHPKSDFGFNIRIYTASHPACWKLMGGDTKIKRVKVEVCEDAWICSEVVLYNCRIGRGAVVALGSVVRSMDVEEYTMVAGNPAKVIARWNVDECKWVYANAV